MATLATDASQAYEDVRNDRTPTNWLVLNYEDEKSDVLRVTATGSGGVAELLEHLHEDKGAFAYLRMMVGNDELSQRAKFVFISWIGPKVKVMRKAKLSVHIANVKAILPSFAIEVSASTKEDLNPAKLQLLLKKAMGANYDRQTSAY